MSRHTKSTNKIIRKRKLERTEKSIKEDVEWGLYSKKKYTKNIKSQFGRSKFKDDAVKIKKEMKKWWK